MFTVDIGSCPTNIFFHTFLIMILIPISHLPPRGMILIPISYLPNLSQSCIPCIPPSGNGVIVFLGWGDVEDAVWVILQVTGWSIFYFVLLMLPCVFCCTTDRTLPSDVVILVLHGLSMTCSDALFLCCNLWRTSPTLRVLLLYDLQDSSWRMHVFCMCVAYRALLRH